MRYVEIAVQVTRRSSNTVITPIVFWASFKPCPSEYAPADTRCSPRKLRSAPLALARVPSQLVTSMIAMVRISPSVGESTMAISVLLSPAHWTTSSPLCATPAPISPPTSAWLDDDGMPLSRSRDVPEHRPDQRPENYRRRHQILVDQPLPDRVGDLVQLRPLQRQEVSAEVEEAANATAAAGLSSRVPTTVAIELAASWSPFKKSNASATMTKPISSGRASSCIRSPRPEGQA